MSLTLSVGIAVDGAHVPAVFVQLLERLLERGTIVQVDYYEKYSLEPKTGLPDSILATLQPFLQHLVPSRDALKLRLQYPVAPGHAIGFDLYCYGRGFNDGYTVLFDGHIHLSLAYSYLQAAAAYRVQPPLPPGIMRISVVEARAITTAEELFFRACGLYDPAPLQTTIAHAALYHEMKWPAAAWCSLLYHREVTAFAQDFWDIYAHYHWGLTPMRCFYEPLALRTLDPPNLPQLPTQRPIKALRHVGVSSWDPEAPAMRHFLEQLDRPTVERLTHLSSATLRALLLQAGATLPGVVCYDVGERGMVLATDPTRSLWRVYAYIAQHAP